MKDFETALTDIVDILVELDVTEAVFDDALRDVGLGALVDLVTDEDNTRTLKFKAALRKLWRNRGLDSFEDGLKGFADDPELDAAVNALFEATMKRRDGWYVTPEKPWDCHVTEDGAFVNREVFRSHVEKMLEDVGPKRVLLISGDGMIGKSYSRELLKVVARRRGFDFAAANLHVWDEPYGATVRDVATSLARQLELKVPEPKHTTPIKMANDWAVGLADQITAKMRGKTPWIFIDHLDTSSADLTEVLPFVRTLAILAAEDQRNFRLVVVARNLSDVKALGHVAAKRALHEQVGVIADSDIKTYLTGLAKHVNKPDCFDDDAVGTACEEIWRRAGGQGQIADLPICLWTFAKENLSS